MTFEDDAFISYAHLDNHALVEGGRGWVANLHRALEIRLGERLGKKPQIWRDPKLRGNDELTATLVERLKHVAVLIAVVSPPYIRSEWTRKELHEFCKAAEQQSGTGLKRARIFKVVKMPVPVPTHPPELQPLLGYEFFTVDPETGNVYELNEVFGPAAQRDFWMRVDDLAQEMSALLEELGTSPGDVRPLPVSQSTVFLAETTSDLREHRETIRRDLQQHGHIVLPAAPLPPAAADAEAAIRADLTQCRMSIHMFGKNYGLIPEGGAQSVLELQNELAIEQAAAGDLCRLLWIRPGLDVVDERQRMVLERLRNDPRLEVGADLLETFLEDFRTLVRTRLDAVSKPVPVKEPALPAVSPSTVASSDIRSVYLIYDQRDAEVVRPWCDELFREQFEVLEPKFEGDEAEVRGYHEDNLRACDGVLIFYGAANEMWVRRKQRELQKIAGYGRIKAAPAVAICVLPPNTAEKERFRTHEGLVIRPGSSYSPDLLAPFVSRLRGAEDGKG
jgi:hypothetical protein